MRGLLLYFAWCTVLYHVIYGGFLLIMNVINCRKILSCQRREKVIGSTPLFVIIIPCWKEQKIIEATINHFAKFRQMQNILKVLLATNAHDAEDDENTTHFLARKAVQRIHAEDFIEVIVCPDDRAGKPQKLNYAIQWWRDRHPAEGVYYCIYDADSRPDIHVFHAVISLCAECKKQPDIFQQISSYCNNISSLPSGNRAVALADAIAQTHWALGFEYSLYEEYRFCRRKNILRPPYYLIGHGCFISDEYYGIIGKIPEINHCDDAALGFLSGLIKADVQVIPVLDACDVAPTSLASIKQAKSWFKGSNQFRNNLKYFMKEYGVKEPLLQQLYWRVREYFRNLFWAWRAPLLLLAAVVGVSLHSPELLVGVLLGFLCFVLIPYVVTVSRLRSIQGIIFDPSPKVILLGSLMTVYVFFFRCIGPLLGFFDINRKGDFSYKTMR